MAEYNELVQALTWLLTNRIQQKIEYIHGLLGDGNGRVRVSTTPNSPEVDYVYVRPDRFSNRTYKVFNKRIEGQDGDPVIIGELPWEPGLIQVVDMDWAAYADVGWGDDVTTTNRHGISHQWRDGAPGIDTFNVYRRQFGDLKTYPAVSGTLAVGVSPYSLDLYGNQYQWPGIQSFSLSGALPAGTGTARMVLVYWDLSSGTTQGFLGVATGTVGSSADATILNRPITPTGAIPSAFVRLKGGQTSVSEFDIWDAREPFRPGILFGTGTTGLSADLIPISDNLGLYTGSTVEAALDQIGFDGGRVSKVYESDFGAVALQADASGNIGIGTSGPDAKLDILATSGAQLRITHTDGSVFANMSVDSNHDMTIQPSSTGQIKLQATSDSTDFFQVIDAGSTVTLNVDSSNNRVGVNTSGPTTDLYVSTPSAVTTLLSIHNPNATGNQFLVFIQDSTQKGIFGYRDSTDTVKVNYGTSSAVAHISVNSSGDTGIGTDTISAQLHVDQSSPTGAQPVLYLDQADVSEEMIEFNTTIGTGNAIEAVGAKTLTPTHFIKVTLPGGLTRYFEVGTIA